MSTNAGKKRASPGADTEKGPSLDLSEEDAKKLEEIHKEQTRAELLIERRSLLEIVPIHTKRREILKSIPKFWPQVLMNNKHLSYHIQHNADQRALAFLEDVWVVRHTAEPRCFTIEFTFGENPFFTDKVLRKEFNHKPPPELAASQPGPDGLSEANIELSWERDVIPTAMQIKWKEPSKALTKLHPRERDPEDEDVIDFGSFFTFFEIENDPAEIGIHIANEVFPDAIDFFFGRGGIDDELYSEDEDSDDDDDDAEEIDLEKPKTKKQKSS